ncbi:MAG: 50S ribosomal protein L4 [Planctomycetota bacterium]
MGIELKKTNVSGQPVGSVTLAEELCGGKIKPRLLHAAAVMYHNNLRQGSACTKTRAEVSGSTSKLFKQKGTGRARAGSRKSGTRRGGGIIHGPKPRDFVYHMPRRQRHAALRNSLLAKAKDGELFVVDALDLEAPKTKRLLEVLGAHGVAGKDQKTSVLIATDGIKRNIHLSGRNVPGVMVLPAQEINARHVLAKKNLLIDAKAFAALTAKVERTPRPRKPKGTRKSKEAQA